MQIPFKKYQATGNDFIVIDNRLNIFPKKIENIHKLCNRRFGIGSDGLILIEPSINKDFEMVFYNPDGSKSLCGNGCRAAVQFAKSLNLVSTSAIFNAFDGVHEALIKKKTITLKMTDVQNGRGIKNGIFMDTGSPHFILFVDNVQNIDVIIEGKKWRNSNLFGQGGANINFVQIKNKNKLFVRTYERGVENETLSCGTGVTASALAAFKKGCKSPIQIETKGGILHISFQHSGNKYNNIWLEGAVEHVFSGLINF